ncbi:MULTISPECIES: hypothetical protein [unclassified Paenibacillus]|uniref:hypothetical protein n=1 Tax=unclassified Paenibacillus TaxID=185978 RepID=UPI002404ED8A|nr:MULTISPECIES: hypothetical protein [unclassified Paenibacillus]MDF9845019.1 hypothetical protein [Paenibacillus sp. PastF-2]MDF9851618.1 hypothetical protein [Paenibacillus sp. PastM-2]MDF9858202.1 hypothetical protein [Paenibacillus sp. PastF-1]MDH6483451.1 hypothetical protein [Paenibacillus sp. PastH-2]MDH6510863.1 hypothetical protein [Paenibacillus sp. PastM-3]
MKRLLKKSLSPGDLSKLFQAGQLTKRSIYGSLDLQVIREHFSITDVEIGDNAILEIPGVTFVFDLEGSSANIRDRGEQNFINTYAEMFSNLTAIIYRNNGIVEKFPGDGISAHFLKLENEPNLTFSKSRAANAAYEIQTYMTRSGYTGYRMSMWTGESTVATTIGNDNHHELISIGHGVNMAHKLEKVIKDNGFTLGMDHGISRYFKEKTNKAVNERLLPQNLITVSEKHWYGVV